MMYDHAQIHIRINGPGMENVKSANLVIDEESAKLVGDALSDLNKQCDPNDFVGWVTLGYHD